MSRISVLELHDIAVDYVKSIREGQSSKEELRRLRDDKEAHLKAFEHLKLNSEDSKYFLAEIRIQFDKIF